MINLRLNIINVSYMTIVFQNCPTNEEEAHLVDDKENQINWKEAHLVEGKESNEA